MKKQKQKHLSRRELIEQLKNVARENRMQDRTPWTAMSVVCAYAVYKSENFKGQRISKVISRVAELEDGFHAGTVDVEAMKNALFEKADFTIEYMEHTEADIRAKKGSYQYWIESKQIAPGNEINRQATRYLIFFFTALSEVYGYGKERLTRVQEELNKLLENYIDDVTTVKEWRKELLDGAGIVFENPIDPLTQG